MDNNKIQRSSNLELYRIICMFMIAIGHYLHNSGLLTSPDGIPSMPNSLSTYYLLLMGMWGKTGINCFLLITGYFMCTSKITIRKFLKLILWIYLYKITIFAIFYFMGYESLSIYRVCKLLMPIWGLSDNFTSCFIVFWLTIPFWNILIKNMTKHQHELFALLLIFVYSVLGNIPMFNISFNYVSWFGVLYLISSYIRLYPCHIFENKRFMGGVSVTFILLAMVSVVVCHYTRRLGDFFFVTDSNKFLSLAVAVTTFLWFKSMNIKYSKVINIIGASTFGVLLIHANSDAMRTWLWRDIVDCVGHLNLSLTGLILYSIGTTSAIFIICTVIDILRIRFIETPFFKWYDKKERFTKLNKLLSDNII